MNRVIRSVCHRVFVILSVLLILFAVSACSTTAGTLEDVVRISENRYSCSFDGVRHDFIVDSPEKTKDSGLVLMLHGYGGTAESFRQETAFHESAVSRGYTVVYVSGASDPEDRTSSTGWNHEGRKSGNRDAEFLSALAEYVEDLFHTDPGRCFAVGFSNGAFMCHRLMIKAQDRFSAVVAVAGAMPQSIWKDKSDSCSASLLQITGEKDNVISKHSDGSSRFSPYPAIEDVIGYYVVAEGLDHSESQTLGKGSVITRYTGANNDKQVWHLLVKDGRHVWSAESITGIDTNALILEFLDTITQ